MSEQNNDQKLNMEDENDKIQTLEKEIADLKDQFLRAKAETDNARRRARIDVENAHKFGLERFAKALLTVVDSLEKGLEIAAKEEGEQAKAHLEGLELTYKMLLGVLEDFDVEKVNPEGEKFDPGCHEALSMSENEEVKANTVLTVVQPGFTLSGRLLRPARVIVAKGKNGA